MINTHNFVVDKNNAKQKLVDRVMFKKVEKLIKHLENMNNIPKDSHLLFSYIFDSPVEFDRAVYIDRLNGGYLKFIKKAIEYIEKEVIFYDLTAKKYIVKNLDIGLIKKQTYHIFTSAKMFGGITQVHVKVAAAYILAKIIPLQVLDTWIDYSKSPNLNKDMLSSVDIRTAWVVHNTSLYTGIHMLLSNKVPREVGQEAMNVFREVSQAMSNCYLKRYSLDILNHPEKELDLYMDSPISRLLGSGFYQVSLLVSLAIEGKKITKKTKDLTANMRRMRQFVDEIADWREDIRSGEITLPFLYLLTNKKYKRKAQKVIKNIWKRSQEIIACSSNQEKTIFKLEKDKLLNFYLNECKHMLVDSGTFALLYTTGNNLWIQTLLEMNEVFKGKNYYDIALSINLKRAFLERLKRQDWEDIVLKVV